jgi:hypothetical protein
MKQIKFSSEEVISKHWMIVALRDVLKEEFIGIEKIIDKVVDSLSSWFILPELQERPVVINLLGMTCEEKKMLAVRIAELLNLEKQLLRCDMENNTMSSSWLEEMLNNHFLTQKDLPLMVILDEFQYAKTKNEDNRAMDDSSSRIIWDMLNAANPDPMPPNAELKFDFSKTVILMVGNLDEPFSVNSEFNQKINSNDFHESSEIINRNYLKKVVRQRLKNKQISRSGNNHIFFPASSEASFFQLIELELQKIKEKYYGQLGIQLKFTLAFKKLLYEEGVLPTQGRRPLFSTIDKMVNTKIPMLVYENLSNNLDADMILFDFVNGMINYEYYKEGWPLYNFDESVLSVIDEAPVNLIGSFVGSIFGNKN